MEFMGANGSRTTDDDDEANNNNKEQHVVSKSKCWSIPSRRRRGANNTTNANIDDDDDDDEHYRPSTVVISKPKNLELNEGTNPVDPTLLGSAMLINSWKAPSTANMTPPVTPISTDSSCSVEGFSLSQPTQETLMQIIRCFPFPTPTGSSENSPYCERKFQRKRFNANNNNSNNNDNQQQQQSTATNNINNTNTNATATTTTNNSATACVERSRSLHCTGRQFRASIANVIRRKTDKEKWALEMENNGGGGERTNRNMSVANSIDAIQRRSALEKLAQVSVDTMAITALPLDCWLKERLKNWVQLSGHEGTIVPATDQTLWKRKGANDYTEAKAYRCLMQDPLIDGFVPRFYKEIDYKNESFIEIQDLTAQFKNPAIMDIKMGTRTFSECDVQNTTKRADLYEKMIAQNPSEPTDEERQEMAITKLRYMQFREKESSSALLGFRIEAAKMPGGVLKKSFKKVKTRQEVADTLQAFFGAQPERVRKQFLVRLRKMREAVERSFFFKHHEVVGSSLLLVYDDVRAGVWMIDFAKSKPVDDHLMNHRCEWQLGNHEDGYFTGLDNLINCI